MRTYLTDSQYEWGILGEMPCIAVSSEAKPLSRWMACKRSLLTGAQEWILLLPICKMTGCVNVKQYLEITGVNAMRQCPDAWLWDRLGRWLIVATYGVSHGVERFDLHSITNCMACALYWLKHWELINKWLSAAMNSSTSDAKYLEVLTNLHWENVKNVLLSGCHTLAFQWCLHWIMTSN